MEMVTALEVAKQRQEVLNELNELMFAKTEKYGTSRFNGDLGWKLTITMFDLIRKGDRIEYMTKMGIVAEESTIGSSLRALREEVVDLAGYAVIALQQIDAINQGDPED